MSDNQASEWADAQDKLNEELSNKTSIFSETNPYKKDTFGHYMYEQFNSRINGFLPHVWRIEKERIANGMNDLIGIDLASGPDHTAIMHEDGSITRIRDGKVIE